MMYTCVSSFFRKERICHSKIYSLGLSGRHCNECGMFTFFDSLRSLQPGSHPPDPPSPSPTYSILTGHTSSNPQPSRLKWWPHPLHCCRSYWRRHHHPPLGRSEHPHDQQGNPFHCSPSIDLGMYYEVGVATHHPPSPSDLPWCLPLD